MTAFQPTSTQRVVQQRESYQETPQRGVPTVITDMNGNKRVVYVQQQQAAQNPAQYYKKEAPSHIVSTQQRQRATAFRDSAHYNQNEGTQFLSPGTDLRYVQKQ